MTATNGGGQYLTWVKYTLPGSIANRSHLTTARQLSLDSSTWTGRARRIHYKNPMHVSWKEKVLSERRGLLIWFATNTYVNAVLWYVTGRRNYYKSFLVGYTRRQWSHIPCLVSSLMWSGIREAWIRKCYYRERRARGFNLHPRARSAGLHIYVALS